MIIIRSFEVIIPTTNIACTHRPIRHYGVVEMTRNHPFEVAENDYSLRYCFEEEWKSICRPIMWLFLNSQNQRVGHSHYAHFSYYMSCNPFCTLSRSFAFSTHQPINGKVSCLSNVQTTDFHEPNSPPERPSPPDGPLHLFAEDFPRFLQ